MLTCFDRYLLRTVAFTTLIALVFLLSADLIIQISGEADEVGKGQFTVSVLLIRHLLLLPEKFTLFAPAAVLIGTIMGLGQLNVQNEITIIQAVGISRLRLIRGAVIFALLMGILSVAASEFLVSKWHDRSELLRNQALGRSSYLTQSEGIWLHHGKQMVHISHFDTNGGLQGLYFYYFADGISEITYAPSAHYQASNWKLESPRRFQTTTAQSIEVPAPDIWENAPSPADLQQLAGANRANTIYQLYQLTRFMKANNLNFHSESLRLWQLLLMPLTILVMVLLALPFAFGHNRSGNQQGTRLVMGIFLGVAYYVVSGVLANLALLLGWLPFFGAVLPIIIFTCVALLLLNHQA